MARILLLFLDGVGIGEDDPESNPFLSAHLPVLTGMAGGPIVRSAMPGPSTRATPGPRVLPVDACLGVAGLPQSGTGQIALLTGVDAPGLFGAHLGPWPPVRLRPILAERNVLVRARRAGAEVAFANAYPRGYPGTRNPRRVAAPPLAAKAAGVLDRHDEELARGHAVASEIVNDGWRRHLGFDSMPLVTPREAGGNLARIAGGADLTLYAHYLTDTAGHRGGMAGAVEALERVDAFLGGVSAELPDDVLLLVASDHGNVEDIRTGHTRNPALAIVAGPGAEQFPATPRLVDLAPTLLSILGVEAG